MTKAKLFDAVQRLDRQAVRAILDATPQLLEVRDKKGRNLLHLACAVPGDARKMADLLLERGLDIESRSLGKDECTPLFFAVARSRDPKLVAHLIERGASPTHAPGGGLFAAVWYDDVKNLKMLVDAGAEVDVVVGWTPFLTAWNLQHFACARVLVERGANPNVQDRKSGRTALHFGIDKGFDPSQLKWLVAHGASVDLKNRKGMSAREQAARKRDKRWLDALESR
jgi:ankyrin repeat protein